MPSGEYRVDPAMAGLLTVPEAAVGFRSQAAQSNRGWVERFSCAPGPAGWRYTATVPEAGAERRVDVTVDARWRQSRVDLRAGEWTLRGGLAGREVLWLRSSTGAVGAAAGGEFSQEAAGFTGASPVFLVTVGRMLALPPGGSAAVRLLAIEGDALAARTVRQRWSLLDVTEHAAELRPLPVERFEVTDLDTGVAGEVHLAGDVVLAAPGIELIALDGPPNLEPLGPV